VVIYQPLSLTDSLSERISLFQDHPATKRTAKQTPGDTDMIEVVMIHGDPELSALAHRDLTFATRRLLGPL
jgi:hypothetical protein